MNCAEFESVVEALGRGDPMEEGVRRGALSHAEKCAACSRQLDEARALTAVLRSVAQRNRQSVVSPSVEARLMEAFDDRSAVTRVSVWRYRAFVGAVASLFLFGAALMTLAPPPSPLARDKRPAAIAPTVDARTADVEEIATEFFPLQGDLDLDEQESSEIVRVSLPRTTLLAFGLPMNEERAFEPLQAEILVGEDGAARAIRFLTTRP
jgi:hypothetical protein